MAAEEMTTSKSKGMDAQKISNYKFIFYNNMRVLTHPLCRNRTYEWQYTYSHTRINTLLAMGIRIGLTTSCRHIIRTYA